MWRNGFNIKWDIIGDFLVLVGTHNNQSFVFPPLGNINDIDGLRQVLLVIDEYFKSQGKDMLMMVVPQVAVEPIRRASPWNIVVTEDRDNFDYVYNLKDLIHLQGRKYHSKKNHINKFLSQYDYVYEEITPSIVRECLDFEEEWCKKKDSDNPELIAEQYAIKEALNNFEKLKLKGSVIKINGKVEAFTFGEALNDCTAVVHIEKANPDINGLYAVINQQFCLRELSGFKFINREEDMGIEGLRRAKESYHPVKLEKKYTIHKG